MPRMAKVLWICPACDKPFREDDSPLKHARCVGHKIRMIAWIEFARAANQRETRARAAGRKVVQEWRGLIERLAKRD